MDSRFSFIGLFADQGKIICIDQKLSIGLEGISEYWRNLGYVIDGSMNKASQSSLFFYRSKLFSKNVDSSTNVEYILVPSIKNPRWLIKNDTSVILNHGPIIKPTSLRAKIIWKVARLLARIHLFTLVFPYRMIVKGTSLGKGVNRRGDLFPSILYTGSPGKYQKFTIQYIDNNNNPVEYLKVANTNDGIKRIKNEVFALQQLSLRKLAHAQTPSMINVVSFDDYYGFIQTNILRNDHVSTEFLETDEAFIIELYDSFEHKVIKLSEYLTTIDYDDSIKCFTDPGLAVLLEKYIDNEIVLTISHGDYIPWNRFCGDGISKVIDWETLGFRPIFYDVSYFFVHKTILIDKGDIISAIGESKVAIQKLLNSHLQVAQEQTIDIELYILLILFGIISHYLENGDELDRKMLEALKCGVIHIVNQDVIGCEAI